MKSRRRLLPVFFLFFFLAIGLFIVSQTPFGKNVTAPLEQFIMPVQKAVFTSFSAINKSTPESEIREENTKLLTQLAELEELKKENKALRDQFGTNEPAASKLMPAEIIGGNERELILDKGEADGLKSGAIVVVKNNVIGRITNVSAHRALAELVTNTNVSFTVKTAKTSALGIGKGRGDGKLLIDNVGFEDKLEKNDLVLTKGDQDKNGHGYPPDLVVGKIQTVSKKTSELFQSAEVEPLVDVAKLKMVFILTEGQ